MILKAFPAALIVVAVTSTGQVWAEQPSYTAEDVTACSHDAVKFCRDKLADLNAIESCMRENLSKLRPACQARFNREQ